MGYPLFLVIAIPLVLAALGVVVNRNPIRSALCLVSALFLLAVLFLFLNAHMVAALQIIVYAGAIMVLFLFVIMLLNLQREPDEGHRRATVVVAALSGALFALALVRTVWNGPGAGAPGAGVVAEPAATYGTTAALGERLFTQFLLPFELTSVLLLVAVIGAVVVAKRKLG